MRTINDELILEHCDMYINEAINCIEHGMKLEGYSYEQSFQCLVNHQTFFDAC